MLRLLNQNNVLSQEFGKLTFITLGNNFRWIVKNGNILGYGFSENTYITSSFVNYSNTIPNDSVYTGIKLTVNYKATQYRQPVSTERVFPFSNYLRSTSNKVPLPEDLRLIVNGNTYNWRSIHFTDGWMVDEELLNRDLNMWLVTMCSQ